MSCRSHRPRAALLALALLIALASPAVGRELELRCRDARSGEPVAGAALLLPGSELRAETDGEGRAVLADLPDAPFTLVCSHLAYEPQVLLVTADQLAGGRLALDLTPTFYEGEKMVVMASRYGPDLHLTRTNLTREDIERRAGEKDLPHLLETTPGLYATDDAGNGVGYTYLKLRGFDQKRIGVMVNGIPLNDPEDHQVYWVDLPDLASSLEDVQIQRGVSNSLGGMSAIAGSVNFVTEAPRDEAGGLFSVATGSFGTQKQTLSYHTGLLGGRFASNLRVSHVESEGYRDRSGSDQWGVYWSGRYLTPNTATQLNVYTGRELSHQAWFGLGEQELIENRRGNPETYANAVDDFRQPHYELHHRWNLRENMVLKTSLYWIHGEGYYENFKEGERAEDFSLDLLDGFADSSAVNLVRRKNVDKDQYGLVTRLLWEKGPSRLVFGGDWYDFSSHHWGEVLAADGVSAAEIAGLPNYYDYSGDKTAWSLYANEQFELLWGFTALADLHYQRKSYDFLQNASGNFQGALRNGYGVDYDWFNPKGGLFWSAPGEPLGGELGLYAHYGIAHREPTDSEVFDTWDGPDDLGARPLFGSGSAFYQGGELQYIYWTDPLVEEEKVKNYELGLSWRGRVLSLAANGYLMEFENEIVPYGALSEDGAGIRGNAELTLHRGFELAASALISEWDLFAGLDGEHRLELAFARSWDQFEKFGFYDYDGSYANLSGNPIAGYPEHLATVALRSDFGELSTSFQLRSAGKQYLDNTGDDARTIDGYQVVDVGLQFRPAFFGLQGLERALIDLKLYNALDVEYETWGYYDAWGAGNIKVPAAKSHFLLGVRYGF